MVFIVVSVILVILLVVGVVVAPYFVVGSAENVGALRNGARVLSVVAFLLLFLPFLALSAWEPIGAGHVGVSYDIGGNIIGTRAEGDKFQVPWQTTQTVSVQRQVYRPDSQCSNGAPNCLDTFSNDNQDVFVSPSLNYSIDPAIVETLLRENPNYVDRSIVSRVNQIVKDETVKYDATELAQGRELVRASVKARLVDELEPIGITVEDFLVDNIAFKADFQASIDEKVRAEQEAIAAQNRVAVAEAEARQKAATALGEADRLRIEAQGQADANALLNASLTPALIQYQAIQKLADDIQIMLLPSEGNIIFDPTRLLPVAAP